MAEAFARLHGGDDVDAHSAGSAPSGRVNPTAIEVMAELGYNLRGHRSKSTADLPDGTFDVLVSMGCGDRCPTVPAHRREEWEIPDPKALPLDDFRLVRDRIETEVRQLIARELARATEPTRR
jgi:protein-tyrosine-phosphatase